jgi:hypothetical protein
MLNATIRVCGVNKDEKVVNRLLTWFDRAYTIYASHKRGRLFWLLKDHKWGVTW